MNTHPAIGSEVVRAKGDYVVGMIGTVIAIDTEKNRAQVNWLGGSKTWVSVTAIEPTSIPYEIIPGYYDHKKHKGINPQYLKK